MSKTLINVIIVLLLASAAVLGYWYFGGTNGPSESIGLSTDTVETVGELAGSDLAAEDSTTLETDRQFVELLAALQSVESTINIFDDPVFASGFTNFQKPLPSVSAGRANPFAPLPGQTISGSRR